MRLNQSVALFILALVPCATAYATITIDTVPVANIGNPNDPGTGNFYGGVNYAYRIGKYEVTVGQYTAFLNAVAATDTYNLYNPNMAASLQIAGIDQSGSPGSYTYSVIGSPNRPVTFVSWGDAARFANWLQNGQPSGGQNSSTTEDGAYTLNGATSYLDLYSIMRNPAAKWFIPSENEWYKAAYYQPATQGGDSDDYWDYPMRTNSVPYSDQPPGTTPNNTRVGNFYKDDGVANGYDDGYAVSGCGVYTGNCLTDGGAYTSSPSFYGTFDQGGNVWEWNEAQVSISGLNRGIRGGSFSYGAEYMTPAYWWWDYADGEHGHIGFRVASIPEPSTAALIGLAAVALFNCRRRRVR
jgi:sulfatase modifying factor 1